MNNWAEFSKKMLVFLPKKLKTNKLLDELKKAISSENQGNLFINTKLCYFTGRIENH